LIFLTDGQPSRPSDGREGEITELDAAVAAPFVSGKVLYTTSGETYSPRLVEI
jgi:hypothetical protein